MNYTKIPVFISPTTEPYPGLLRICRVPDQLGRVEKLEIKSDRVVAKTESGVDFIMPAKPVEGDGR